MSHHFCSITIIHLKSTQRERCVKVDQYKNVSWLNLQESQVSLESTKVIFSLKKVSPPVQSTSPVHQSSPPVQSTGPVPVIVDYQLLFILKLLGLNLHQVMAKLIKEHLDILQTTPLLTNRNLRKGNQTLLP